MPGSYTLELEAFSLLNATTSNFEIWADGALLGSYSINSAGTSIFENVSFTGAMPSSLEFRFDDANAGTTDQIDLRSIRINGRSVNTGNFLSSQTLNDGETSTVAISNNNQLFDDSEPNSADFTTNATQTFTTGRDIYRGFENNDPQTFDMLDGNDLAYLGDGADKISGGAGNDKLFGLGGDDLLFGDTGNDKLDGGLGNDTLYGGDGRDRLFGREGNDILHGGIGNDSLNGNDGNDTLYGGDDDDRLNGSDGQDFLFGDDGDDTLVGGIGNDTLDGGIGDDLAYGGTGDDFITGGDGADTLIGNDGEDTIHGDDGNDTILGLNDDDTLFGGDGRDDLFGGSGNDTLDGGNQDDDLFGGSGNDTLNGGSGADSLNGNDGTDILNGGAGDDTIFGDNGAVNFENGLLVIEAENFESTIIQGGHEWEVVTDTTASNGKTLYVDDNGAETIYNQTDVTGYSPQVNYTVNFATTGTFYIWIRGRAGLSTGSRGQDDSVHLGFDGVQQTNAGGITGFGDNYSWGSNSTTGGRVTVNVTTPGEHTLNLWMREDGVAIDKIIVADTIGYTPTGSGSDQTTRTSVTGGIDTIDGGDGNDTIFGDFGNDTIDGGNGDDIIYGGTGIDNINGGNDDDFIYGDAGNDIINGGSGDDVINGGVGDDVINGGDNNDIIYAGDGDDTVNGGAGNDTIYSTTVGAVDEITAILAANPNITYNESTGNFYEFVRGDGATNFSWTQANAAAQGSTLGSASGHLVTITSAAEDSLVNQLVTNTDGSTSDVAWTAGVDTGIEGVFAWADGPEAGTVFWNGGSGTGEYTNWFNGQSAPNNSAANDYVLILFDGSGFDGEWYAFSNNVIGSANPSGYVVEWEGDEVLGTTDTSTLSGGDGSDTLYGTDGVRDIFDFNSGETGSDVIENFTAADTDALDIADMLTGYTAGVSDINDFVRFTNSGADTLVQVDANGGAGGVNFTTIATINDLNDLDADALLYNGSIIA